MVMVIAKLIVGDRDSNDKGDVDDNGGVDSDIGNDANCCYDKNNVDCNEDRAGVDGICNFCYSRNDDGGGDTNDDGWDDDDDVNSNNGSDAGAYEHKTNEDNIHGEYLDQFTVRTINRY